MSCRGISPIPDISRAEAAAAARRRAMKPYSLYCEWPATQRMRPDRLARRVKIRYRQMGRLYGDAKQELFPRGRIVLTFLLNAEEGN